MAKLKDINFFILDLDGTIYLENNILPGSLEFLKKAELKGKKFVFLTNNSSKNRADYKQKLAEMKIRVKADQIINSGEITASYLAEEEKKDGKKIYLLGTEALKKEMQRFGHQIMNGVKNIREKPAALDYVVLGFDKNLTYQRLWDAHQLILSGVKYIATHPDLVCPLRDGKTQPDTGAMIELLAASTGKRPLTIGKPSPLTVNYIIQRFNLKKSEIAVVGDRLYTDMKMAAEAGITSILLLSGETTKKDLANLSEKERHFDYLYQNIDQLRKDI